MCSLLVPLFHFIVTNSSRRDVGMMRFLDRSSRQRFFAFSETRQVRVACLESRLTFVSKKISTISC